MTLKLALSAELEERLRKEAQRQGIPPEAVTLQLLQEHLPPTANDRRAVALQMLQQWMSEDANLSAKEAADNAALLQALDEDRPSYRKLFEDV
jgi:hypothetical protein